MENTIPYSDKGDGSSRPYIEVEFFNVKNGKRHKTFGVMDSGADTIFLNHSVGIALGFAPATVEELVSASGIGGNIYTVQRKVRVYLEHIHENKSYAFDHDVVWIVPDVNFQKDYARIVGELIRLTDRRKQISGQSGDDFAVLAALDDQIAEKQKEVTQKGDQLEPSNLMGRTFFANFESVTFVQKDRHDHCNYQYIIHGSKIVETIELKI